MQTNVIYWGDCIEVMCDLPDDSIDLIVTDPPYGKNFVSNRQGIDRKQNVKLNNNKKIREKFFSSIMGDSVLPIVWIKESYRVLKEGSALYVFCHWDKWAELYSAVSKQGFLIKNMLVMNKSNHGMGDLKGQYAPKYELVLFATKGRHLLNFPAGRTKDVIDVPVKYSGAIRLHPNEKPVSWMIPLIHNSSSMGDVILDPFLGSGSTAIAAMQEARQFIGIELDYEIYNKAVQRINKNTLLAI